jgi:hypothetical protein
MSTTTAPRLQQELKTRSANTTNPAQPQSTSPAPSPTTPVPNTTQIPLQLKSLEPAEPEVFINDDPVFETIDAAAILGVTADRLVKWRQREQGPDYLQYAQNGHVRYELSSLIAFKAAHRVRPSRQPKAGKRCSR